MLLELINHYHNLHFSIGFTNVAKEAPHYHREAEISLVLRGSVKYKVHHQDFYLETGDMLIVDTRDIHYIYDSSEDVILLTSYIDVAHFEYIYPDIDYMIFACEQLDTDMSVSHQRIQNKIAFMTHYLADMFMMIQDEHTSDKLLEEKLLDIIDMMVNNLQGFFVENNQFQYGADNATHLNLERLSRIISFLYANYDKNITLNDIAQLEHLSIYYISHLIKNTSGLSFQKLISYIRVEYSEKLLNETDKTLTQISEACGFSSLAYFNKCFNEWYHMTPAEYRKQVRPVGRTFHGKIDMNEAMALLMPYANHDFNDDNLMNEYDLFKHETISLSDRSESKQTLREKFPLDIYIDSKDDLERMLYYTDDILTLAPNTITTSEDNIASLSSDPILYSLSESGLRVSGDKHKHVCKFRTLKPSNVADAYEKIFACPREFINIFGDTSAIFTKHGFPTAYYSAYKAFALISGKVTNMQQHYAVIQDEGLTTIILSNASGESHVRFQINFAPDPVPKQISKRTFTESPNINTLLTEKSYSEEFDYRLRKHLFDFASGSVDFMIPESDAEDQYEIDVTPNTLMILSFSRS